jgi:hypothetical protein
MTDVAELLESIVPRYEGTGDWNRVLRDAEVDRRPLRVPSRLSVRLAAAAAVALAVVGAVVLWPAGGTGPSVVERALAATGEGQVLHLVYEGDRPRTLVDFETGERTEIRSRNEVWFDPEAGLRQIELFDGVVQFDTSIGAEELHEHTSSFYSSLGAGYREALESREAEVVGEDSVDGTEVYWIRVEGTHDVAVSRDTFEPVYIRVMQDGAPALTRIVSYETIPAGSAPLETTSSPSDEPTDASAVYGDEIELSDAAAHLGHEPVWAGTSLNGLPLESVRELQIPHGRDGSVPGLSLFYGTVREAGSRAAHVEIMQAPTLADGLTMLVGLQGYAPPEGTALLAGSMALLRLNGLVVGIHAPDEQTAIAVARSLRPYAS